jgi:uncharacterized repeat protein (TIGR03803 family)
MIRHNRWKMVGAIFVLCGAMAIAAPAQTFTTVANTPGRPFFMSLIQGRDGDYYGTIRDDGGGFGYGSVFKITPGGELTTLYSFCTKSNCADGAYPQGALVQATNGSFYGTTLGGGNGGANGSGTIFKITQEGNFSTVYRFCAGGSGCTDGSNPEAGLIQAADGNLYGTTVGGGSGTNACACGTVFKITLAGTLTTLHSFELGEGGIHPFAGVIQGTDGNFYGTTSEGGINNKVCFDGSCGTIFRMTPGAAVRTVHKFHGKDGSGPYAGLIQASDGNFYGVTSKGGDLSCSAPYGCGTVFTINLAGTFTTLHSFDIMDGAAPFMAPTQATDGNLYGTTIAGGSTNCTGGCGTMFQITPDGSLTTLHIFCVNDPCTDGSSPSNGLVQGTDGTLYGTSSSTVYSENMGFGPFVTFVNAAGRVGQTGGILGQEFTGTTSVSLNGIAASFTVVSDTFIEATVPVGGTTGYVTVTTPSGTLTSNVPFRVIP